MLSGSSRKKLIIFALSVVYLSTSIGDYSNADNANADNQRTAPGVAPLARLRTDSSWADDTERLELRAKISRATDIFEELAVNGDIPEIPTSVSSRAECIAVLPGVVKAAFLAGGQHGSGIVSCRDDKLGWTAPAFVTMSSGSFGLQIGAQEVDIVLLMMSKDSARSLTFNKLTLGGDIAVAAGPVGRLAKGETDLSLSGIFSYAISRGAFAGISLEGSVLRPDDEATSAYYKKGLVIEDLLFKYSVIVLPNEASRFVAGLPRW